MLARTTVRAPDPLRALKRYNRLVLVGIALALVVAWLTRSPIASY